MYQPIPDSTVLLFKNIPLDKGYNHSILWEAEAGAISQEQYFQGRIFRRADKATYIRETGNIWLEFPRDELIGVNYLAYRNTSYIDKWFYAFVDELIYKNDNCTEIRFTIDVLQTYLCDSDWTVKSAYIEREHVRNDDIGANILPEPIESGERVAADIVKPAFFADWDVVAFSGVDAALQPIRTNFEPGQPVYSGLRPVIVATGRGLNLGNITAEWNITTHTTFLDDVLGDTTRDLSKVINNITMIPSVFSSTVTGTGVNYSVPKVTENTAIGANTYYIPRNRKLYTKQFCSLFVTDGNGGGKEYAFEDFYGNTAEFSIFCDKAPNPSLIAIPNAYRCDAGKRNINEAVIMDNLPQCSWNSDGYAAWFGATARTFQPITAAAKDIANLTGIPELQASFATITEGTGTVPDVLNDLFPSLFAAKDVPTTNGTNSASVFMAIAAKAFMFYTLTPKAENARVIDAFFDRYGYKTMRLGNPDLRCRTNYKYVKTREIIIDGGAPAEALRAIENIFNKGITFWYYPENVGDYTVPNDPV